MIPCYDGSNTQQHISEPKDFDYTIVKNILQEVNPFVNKKTISGAYTPTVLTAQQDVSLNL